MFEAFLIPIITTITPALLLARFVHLKEVCAKYISKLFFSKSGQRIGTCWPWVIEFVETNANDTSEVFAYSDALINHPDT